MTGRASAAAQGIFPLMRDPVDRDVFHITASGSQVGALIPSDIVPVQFSRVSWGDGRASTESTIHRRILAIPGVEEFSFVPIDRTGAWILGRVPSGTYREPVGSKEMESRIPRYLAGSPATLVKGHGPFVRGESLQECLHLLGVVDASAKLLQAARTRGVDTTAIARRIRDAGPASFYPMRCARSMLPGSARTTRKTRQRSGRSASGRCSISSRGSRRTPPAR